MLAAMTSPPKRPLQLIDAGDHRLEHAWIGRGRPGPVLVFLHEGLGSLSQWKDFPERLCDLTGLSGLVYSRRGYGASDPAVLPRGVGFMHEEARCDLPRVLAATGVEDAILVGHSDGASIALIYAGEGGGGIRGLALIAPHVMVEAMCVEEIARRRAEYGVTELREKLARHHTDVDATFHGWVDVWLHPDFRRWDIRPLLAGVRVPVLVVQGADDAYGTLAQVDAVRSGVRGPAERLIVPGAGHSPQRDAPDEVLGAMARFITVLTRT